MHSETLDDTNFLLYAAKNYTNPGCYEKDEFLEDLSRFKYIRRLLNRYESSGELKERLILNHIMILYNVFGIPGATRMLFYKLEGREGYLKTFLEYLNLMPKKVEKIGPFSKTIKNSEIQLDQEIHERLKRL